MNRFNQFLRRFQESVIIRLLEQHRRRVIRDGLFQCLEIRKTIFLRNDDQFGPASITVCPDDIDHFRINRRGDIVSGMLPIRTHGGRLCRRRRSVVNRRVGDIHPRQFTDHGLIFKNRLQYALADFRLIRRIRGDKFFIGRNLTDNGRNIVPVSARAPENRVKYFIFCCYGAYQPGDFQL